MKTKHSISYELMRHLSKDRKFQFGGTLEKEMSGRLLTKPSNISRRLRELAEEGKIDRTYEYVSGTSSRVVMYRGK